MSAASIEHPTFHFFYFRSRIFKALRYNFPVSETPSFSFQSLTRASDIGANCYLLHMGNSRIILDAGTHPKREGADTLPDLEQLPYDSIDAIIISHSHLDHAGALPVSERPGLHD